MNKIHLYNPDRPTVQPPSIPLDYAYRATVRSAEHGPHESTTLERLFLVAGGLALIAFWSFALIAAIDQVSL